MDLYPGARLDRYVLLELLGEGGQGAVWKAKDPLGDGQLRALKLVGLSLSRPNDVERVRREARALSRLQHPSLTTCHALFEDLQRGALGVVMDYVEAVSLKKAQDDPRLDLALKLKVLSHIAHSLAYVHEQGVTHRDLKLDNVLLTHEFWQAPDRPENLKLVDFGIAAVSGNPQPLTALDTVVGTLAYLAPELIDPAHFSGDTLAPTLDIFAFGILGHKLLFGSHPAQTPPNASLIDYAMAYRHAQRLGAAWPEKLEASGLPGVLRDCLALKVDKRIRNGTELSLRVDRALAEPFDTAPYQAMEPPTHVEKADVIPAASESVQSQPVSVTAQTAIASPGAMLGETVEYPVVIASGNIPAAPLVTDERETGKRSSDQPESDEQDAEAVGRPARIAAMVAALGVVSAALALAYLASRGLLGRSNVSPEPIPTMSVSHAKPTELVPDEQNLDAARSFRPPGCSPQQEICKCCASGRDCGKASCSTTLDQDERFWLRPAQVISHGKKLQADYPDASVCVKIPRFGANQVCVKLQDTLSGTYLEVTGLDFYEYGLEVEVYEPASPVPMARAKLKGKVPRQSLCDGLTVSQFEEQVDIDRVVFFLDDPGVPINRCQER